MSSPTGRVPRGPNMQGINPRTEEVRAIREAFVGETHWYRAEAKVKSRVATFDDFGEFSRFVDSMHPTVDIQIDEYRVVRHTPKGAWVFDDRYGRERFVRRGANKRFACPTRAEAVESLFCRLQRRRMILAAQLRDTNLALKVFDGREFADVDGVHNVSLDGSW